MNIETPPKLLEQSPLMESLRADSYLYGGNMPFIEELYESYLADPNSVSEEWRAYFDQLQRTPGTAKDVPHSAVIAAFEVLGRSQGIARSAAPSDAELEKQIKVIQLISAYRFLGVRQANVDPLQRQESPYIAELDPAFYGFTDADMDVPFNTGTFLNQQRLPLRDIVVELRKTYCGSIGTEYMHISDPEQKRWIQTRIELPRAQPSFNAEQKLNILERLTAAETLEKYLHTRYVGQKRFSLEGGDTLIPMLDEVVQGCGMAGVQEIVIGMAHRGRLNVLVNVLGKLPKDLFSEFEGKHHEDLLSGDVKYHNGFSSDIKVQSSSVHLTLAFNPSHLEIVNPVVEGSVRARQQRRSDKEGKLVVPVLLHGDAAFAGQGVIMETLNLSQTRGYRTGGTFHIVINNQIGFTTSDPRDTRSTLYCTDIAKMIEAPIFHVNGDDPEAVVMATQIAFDYRMTFGKDVVIDLVCFRRLGHNEQDEPAVTQPLMYKQITRHPGTRKLYANKLVSEGVIKAEQADEMIKVYREAMDAGRHTEKPVLAKAQKNAYTVDWTPYKNIEWTHPTNTTVALKKLKDLSKKLTAIPQDFKLHPRVEKIIADRRAMGEGKLPLDWGMAENLAYAALIDEGYAVRISGQDSGRGTFFHRHAVLHDQNREKWDAGVLLPLQHIKENQPNFLVIDSLLSEEAVLGFEYGYASAEPNELVIWEAQFGDFANGAQVVIDQFISAGEAKWGRLCGVVMMLPHGYEGQGPEHSSARLERYLQLCAEYNIQVCVPSTPAQMFHMLRRQMLRPYRKPLIIMSPKSLLRHKESVSSLDDLAKGEFQPILSEVDQIDPKKVSRLVICSGKVYFDLLTERRARKTNDVAIIRLEQLYPFPHEQYKRELQRYPKTKQVVWAQEEPKNQGAWYQIQHYLLDHLKPEQKLLFAGRPSSASPAVGYLSKHMEQQKALIDAALSSK